MFPEKDEMVKMARQTKDRLSSKQKEQQKVASGTNLFGIIKNTFKTNTSKSAEFPEYTLQEKSRNPEATARRSETLLLRTAQMLQ
jgi:hypothetical protein